MGEEHLDGKMNDFDGFQVNEDLVANADQDWRFMHCLPAHRGEEVTDGVMITHSPSCSTKRKPMWAQMSIMACLVDPAAWEAMGEFMGLEADHISTLTRKPNNPASMPRRKVRRPAHLGPCTAARWW